MQNSRPPSASPAVDINRPKSASANHANAVQLLLELDSTIRKITKQIKILQREKHIKESHTLNEEKANERPNSSKRKDQPHPTAALDASVVIDQNSIDPILDLEEERHKLLQKYETLNEGTPYSPSPEALIQDFCELFYGEYEYSVRSGPYMLKYYDPQAVLNIVGYKGFSGRDHIVETIIVSV
jgi:hypothetical protein